MSVEIAQADRDAAGELWLALGFEIPDANDGNAAAMLETMAVAFAKHRSTSTEEVERLRPMGDAPRDRTHILALYNPPKDHPEARFRGRWFTIWHEGVTEPAGYDMGWALYPGYGGVSDSNFAGWIPLPRTALGATSHVE